MQSQRHRAPRMSISWSMDMIPWMIEKPKQRNTTRPGEERAASMGPVVDFQHRSSPTLDAKSSVGESSLRGQNTPMFRPYISPQLTADPRNSFFDDAIASQSPVSWGPNGGLPGSGSGHSNTPYFPMDPFSPVSMGLDATGSSIGPASQGGQPAARLSFSPEDLPMLSSPILPMPKNELYRPKERFFLESPKEEDIPALSTTQAAAEELATKCWKQDTRFLDMKQMAMHLGNDDSVAAQARKIFMEGFDLRHCSPLDALRLLSSQLYMNAETNRIDNLLQALGVEYMKVNPTTIFQTEENVNNVLFALFLLNTDLHVAELDTKMNQAEFVLNTCQNLKPMSIQTDEKIISALQEMYCSILSKMLEVPPRLEQALSAAPKRPSMQRALSLGREDGYFPAFMQGDVLLKPQRQGSLLRMSLKNQRCNSVPVKSSLSVYGGKNLSANVQYLSVNEPESVRKLQKPQSMYVAVLEKEHLVLRRELSTKDIGNALHKLLMVHSLTKSHIGSDQSYVSVTLHDGTIHILYMNTLLAQTWVSACNEAAATFTRVPMLEGASNCDYGWLQVQQQHLTSTTPMNSNCPTTPQKSWWSKWLGDRQASPTEEVNLHEWHPPPMSLEPSSTPREGQSVKMDQYIKYLQQELQVHEMLRDPMIQLWKGLPHTLAKATTNWERRHAFLTNQLEKFDTYLRFLSKHE